LPTDQAVPGSIPGFFMQLFFSGYFTPYYEGWGLSNDNIFFSNLNDTTK
jgi:hypothetical protein